MSLASKIRVGVLRGGPSSEHEISVKTGAHVLKKLPEQYAPADIFIDRSGVWHVQGVAQHPEKIFKKVDVLFNALHGEYGENGGLQSLLDAFKIPYTGSGRMACAFSMHKGHAKNFLKRHGIKTPYYKIFKKENAGRENIHELFRIAPHPSVVKPVALGSSVGVSVAESFSDFQKALAVAFARSPAVIIEEYIKGREATCAVVDRFRGQNLYAFLPVEVVPPASRFFDYEAKYSLDKKRAAQLIDPGRFSANEKADIQRVAALAHQALGLRHYSRSDFIVSPKRGIYFLEVDALPDLFPGSPFLSSLASVGSSISEFLDHILKLALSGK